MTDLKERGYIDEEFEILSQIKNSAQSILDQLIEYITLAGRMALM